MKIKSKKFVIMIALVIFGVAGAAPFLIDSIKNHFTSSQDSTTMIENYTKDKKDVKLTIGVLKSDEMNYKIYGMDSKELEPVEYEYEIGSISKTITASILCKAIEEGLVNLEDPISKYLPLDATDFYPTVQSLATHTSGYGEYPFDAATLSDKELEQIDKSFYKIRNNIYRGIGKEELVKEIKAHPLKDKAYDWEYSNFGISVLGTILGDVNNTSYKLLAEDFIKNDLGLTKTRIGSGTGSFDNYWNWNEDDTYIAAAGVVSTVTDMLKYGQMHLNDTPGYLSLSHKTYQTFEKEGFSMGLGWIIDPETGYIWHNGGTSSYTSFLGIDKKHKTVVVILSNYPEKDDNKDDGALDLLGYTLLNNLSKTDELPE